MPKKGEMFLKCKGQSKNCLKTIKKTDACWFTAKIGLCSECYKNLLTHPSLVLEAYKNECEANNKIAEKIVYLFTE